MFSLFLLASALTAGAGPPEARLDRRVFEDRAPGEKVSLLVVLAEQADLVDAAAISDRVARRRFVYETLRTHAERSQAPLRRSLEAEGTRHRPYFLVNMLEVEADEATAREIALRPEVARVAANRSAPLRRPVPSYVSRLKSPAAVEPNIALIRAPQAWERGFTGEGVVVGIADTGVQWDHPAIIRQYRGWNGSAASHDYNWHDSIHDAGPANPCGSSSPAPCDDLGHGTGVTGLAVGDDGAGNQIGVAPGARWIGCRNMESNFGTPARYTECFEFFLAPTDSGGQNPRPELGADVINNSWVCPDFEGCVDPQILRAVVESVRAAGIAVVVAAGNEGPACSTVADVAAIYDASFSIGATTLEDAIALFSSRGPVTRDGSGRLKPDLVAPGVGTRTADLQGGFTFFSGTSAASPHVAGAVALLWSAVPEIAGDVDETELAFERAAIPLTSETQECGGIPGTAVPNPVFGWGRLDIESAIELYRPPREAPLRSEPRAGARVIPSRP